jgi:hypothetical protein
VKLQTHQVAARLQVCRRTVHRWAARGLFAATQDERGRWTFDSTDVDQVRDRLFEGGPIRVVDPYPSGRFKPRASSDVDLSEDL